MASGTAGCRGHWVHRVDSGWCAWCLLLCKGHESWGWNASSSDEGPFWKVASPQNSMWTFSREIPLWPGIEMKLFPWELWIQQVKFTPSPLCSTSISLVFSHDESWWNKATYKINEGTNLLHVKRHIGIRIKIWPARARILRLLPLTVNHHKLTSMLTVRTLKPICRSWINLHVLLSLSGYYVLLPLYLGAFF